MANRPTIFGNEASDDLQRAWVATIKAIQAVLGAVKNGNCFLVNVTAGPLVQQVVGEAVTPCTYAAAVRANRQERVRDEMAPLQMGEVDRCC